MSNLVQAKATGQSSFSVRSSEAQSGELQLEEFIRQVESFEIDPGPKQLSFASRLARENNWQPEFAERVVAEYKRFCILAMQAGHPVTPSEQVDQAWHLHLTYTRSYWDRFCGQVLKRPLHHDPTAGGAAEGGKFRDWYSKTLESYRRIFKAEPPRDIWPSMGERFQHAGSWQWVNVGRAWIVPKRPVVAVAASLTAIGLVCILAGCQPFSWNAQLQSSTFLAGIPPFSWDAGEFLTFYIGLICLALIVLWQARMQDAATTDISQSTTVDPQQLNREEIAVLTGGGSRLAQLAIAELYSHGHIKTKSSWWRKPVLTAVGSGPTQPGLNKDVFDEIQRSKTPNLLRTVQPFYGKHVGRLESLGLRHRSMWYSPAGNWVIAGVLGLGVLRAIQGITTNHSIGFLILSIILFVIVGIVINRRSSHNSSTGENVLRQLHTTQTALASQPQVMGSEVVLMSVALLGGAALMGQPEFEDLRLSIDRIKSNADASAGAGGGCGGGCSGGGCSGGGCGSGGGGCGGGCGGCGGCGG